MGGNGFFLNWLDTEREKRHRLAQALIRSISYIVENTAIIRRRFLITNPIIVTLYRGNY